MSTQASSSDAARQLLRHTVATLAYRGGKVLRDAPSGFSEISAGSGCLSAGAILAHMGHLVAWAVSMASGEPERHNPKSMEWTEDVRHFYAELTALDAYLASDQPMHASMEKLFQGPIADALTHVGQMAMMRRLAGSPISDENYYRADVGAGRVGQDQATPKREF